MSEVGSRDTWMCTDSTWPRASETTFDVLQPLNIWLGPDGNVCIVNSSPTGRLALHTRLIGNAIACMQICIYQRESGVVQRWRSHYRDLPPVPPMRRHRLSCPCVRHELAVPGEVSHLTLGSPQEYHRLNQSTGLSEPKELDRPHVAWVFRETTLLSLALIENHSTMELVMIHSVMGYSSIRFVMTIAREASHRQMGSRFLCT
ncbi:hypothetical protein LIA77_00227 [Sarocladium implicatum]|nr:hypothetical protein LIA77_00227 [Sarocladium implicatum]